MQTNKFERLISMATKAGKLTFGSELVRSKIQSGSKPFLVITSSDASENTKKRIKNCCEYYKCSYVNSNISSDDLGHITGRAGSISCVSVNDEGFASAMITAIKNDANTEVGQNG